MRTYGQKRINSFLLRRGNTVHPFPSRIGLELVPQQELIWYGLQSKLTPVLRMGLKVDPMLRNPCNEQNNGLGGYPQQSADS